MRALSDDPPRVVENLVVGSGFGGSVVAARLAEAGADVCLLERGRAYPPGSFPRSPAGVARNVWSPDDGLFGMFDAWSFTGIDSVVSSGLGGGSLIYANVLLRKDASWFTQAHPYRPGVQERWAVGREELDPHYDRVERFLDVQTVPVDAGGEFDLPKTAAMRTAAGAGGEFALTPLAVRFRDGQGLPAVGADLPAADYPDIHGRPRRTCRLCGECDIGCNDGAKNSLDHTYLSQAAHRGAVVCTLAGARRAARRADGGFDVSVRLRTPDDPERPPRDVVVTARRLVLAAGTYGSTYFLLVNRDALGVGAPSLGTRFCGNGDLLGFWFGADRVLDGTRGPVITSSVRFPDRIDTGDVDDHGMYLEDAGYPAFLAWLAEVSQTGSQLRRASELVLRRAFTHLSGLRRSKLSKDISATLGRADLTEHALPVLGMGRDIPDGTLHLRPDPAGGDPLLDNTWSTRTSQHYLDRMVANMAQLGAGIGADLHLTPTYWLNRVITVHPLGGCPMHTSESAGVVDGYGRVDAVPGLRVCDGSVLPGPVGANPSLTIAAFADRVADDLLDEDPAAPRPSSAGRPAP